MHDARWWWRLRLIRTFSLVLLIVVGCGEKGGTGGGTATGGVSRLALRIMISEQEISRLESRAVLPGQTRQAGAISLLRVEVSGVGISEVIRVNCPIPAGSAQCQVTETVGALIVVIDLTVPSGTRRQVIGTGFDPNGNVILTGTTTVDLTEAEQTVILSLALLTGNSGGTSALRSNGASGAEGDALPFAWALLTRPSGSQATVMNSTSVNPVLVVDRPGTYMVQCTVDDGQMDSLPDVVTIHTVDVDGNMLTLAWSFVTVPVDSQAMWSGAATVPPTFVVDSIGTYVVQLIMAE
jgi:hypothetical protein